MTVASSSSSSSSTTSSSSRRRRRGTFAAIVAALAVIAAAAAIFALVDVLRDDDYGYDYDEYEYEYEYEGDGDGDGDYRRQLFEIIESSRRLQLQHRRVPTPLHPTKPLQHRHRQQRAVAPPKAPPKNGVKGIVLAGGGGGGGGGLRPSSSSLHESWQERNRRHRERLSVLSADGHCGGVLVTSQGGVGSSDFITALGKARDRLPSSFGRFFTNDPSDFDGLKHMPATFYDKGGHHNSTSLGPPNLSGRYADNVCFGKVLVIVGDPVHTIESTYRRFGSNHVNKMRSANGLGGGRYGYPPGRRGLSRLYGDIASTGRDVTGITSYVRSWHLASLDRENWPEIRLVTSRTLYDNAADHARWMMGLAGEEDGGLPLLRHFENLGFDESKALGLAVPSVILPDDDDAMERIRGAFAEVTELVREINQGGSSSQPPPGDGVVL